MTGGAVAEFLGPKLITSVALTGSDPYLRAGSDAAILFETKDADFVMKLIAAQQIAAQAGTAEVKAVSGEVSGVRYSGVVSRDRSICSYLAKLDSAVVVSNSLYQLDRVVQAHQGTIETIAGLEEYAFFRDRYKIGEPDEAALLILSDAAIRRWCSARWRIADSRRTRAAGVLSELQARHLDTLAGGKVTRKPLECEPPIEGMGELELTPTGICSSMYGSLSFLTPIAEMNMEKVTPEESEAYQRWRDRYQMNWRGIFDPIAIRFSIRPAGIGLDVTVRPLIVRSEYREFMEIAGKNAFTATAGDRHGETLFQAILSVDANSPVIQRMGNFGMGMPSTGMFPGQELGMQMNMMGWLGRWVTIYGEKDPFWGELMKVEVDKRGDFMEENLHRLPLVAEAEVANPLILTTFMMSVRALVDGSAPGMTVWLMQNYKEQPYVKITMSAQNPQRSDKFKNLGICYATLPDVLLISTSEEQLHRALDRRAAAKQNPSKNEKEPQEDSGWLGGSMALDVKGEAREMLETLFSEEYRYSQQRRAWGNIPILNEWKKRYSSEQPAEFHQRYWQVKLQSPGGGHYVWNEEYQTMESTVYGHPGQPRMPEKMADGILGIRQMSMGITFEDDGLRARTEFQKMGGQ